MIIRKFKLWFVAQIVSLLVNTALVAFMSISVVYKAVYRKLLSCSDLLSHCTPLAHSSVATLASFLLKHTRLSTSLELLPLFFPLPDCSSLRYYSVYSHPTFRSSLKSHLFSDYLCKITGSTFLNPKSGLRLYSKCPRHPTIPL